MLQTYNFSSRVCSGDKFETFPVLKIASKDIVDTNGAGDAFVGGTISLCFHLIHLWVCFLFFPVIFCGFLLKFLFFSVLQVSCLSWWRRNRWISAWRRHTTPPTSSSDEQVAPSQKNPTSTEGFPDNMSFRLKPHTQPATCNSHNFH